LPCCWKKKTGKNEEFSQKMTKFGLNCMSKAVEIAMSNNVERQLARQNLGGVNEQLLKVQHHRVNATFQILKKNFWEGGIHPFLSPLAPVPSTDKDETK